MVWVYYLLLLIVDGCGLTLAAFTLPGLWLMLGGAAVYALITHRMFLGGKTLIVLLVLAGGAEAGELFVSGRETKKAGASFWGIVGGFIGAIVGGIALSSLVPVIGTIIGICLGSFAGAFGVEMFLGQAVAPSLRIGVGAAKGRFYGIVLKVMMALLMWAITLWTAFPIHGSH